SQHTTLCGRFDPRSSYRQWHSYRLLDLLSSTTFFFFHRSSDHRDLHSFLHDALPISYLINFNHFQASWVAGPEGVMPLFTRDPDFDDPLGFSPLNKKLWEQGVETMNQRLAGRPDLIDKMTPSLPPMTSRPLLVDSSYNIYH